MTTTDNFHRLVRLTEAQISLMRDEASVLAGEGSVESRKEAANLRRRATRWENDTRRLVAWVEGDEP